MARFRGSNWKKSRRLGISLSGTGKELENVLTHQDNMVQTNVKKLSEYGLQLRENKNYVTYMEWLKDNSVTHLTSLVKKFGVHGENFMILLASRLDAVVYSLGLARTRRQARQLVNHGHILVDGKRVDIPSYSVKPGQTISVRENLKIKHHRWISWNQQFRTWVLKLWCWQLNWYFRTFTRT